MTGEPVTSQAQPSAKRHRGARPVRRDAVDRDRMAAARLIRFVVDPEGCVLPDIANKLPGRGIWLKPERARIAQAAKRGVFARSAKRPVSVAADLAERVDSLLMARMLETAALARRAGQIVTGFDKVQTAMKVETGGVLVLAKDAGVEAKRLIANWHGGRYIAAFEREELGRKLGRSQTVYALMTAGALAERMVSDARRLAGFRDFEMALAEPSVNEEPRVEELTNERVSLTQ